MTIRRKPHPRSLAARPVEALEPRTLLSAQMVRDINTTPAGSPVAGSIRGDVAEVNGTLVFAASDGLHGEELWSSDGTAAGTRLLKDINPGPSSSSPGYFGGGFSRAGNQLFFLANDGWRGTELWATDGTADGTRLVADLDTTPWQAMPQNLRAVGDTLYFTFDDQLHLPRMQELWKSDGTRDGTTRIFPFPGQQGGASVPVEFNGSLYFNGGSDAGSGLWVSDGTFAGTRLLSPQTSTNLTAAADAVYFHGTGYDGHGAPGLWATDGTPEGTRFVAEAPPFESGLQMAAAGGTLYFTGTDGELWKTGGTPELTVRVRDISAKGASSPRQLTAVGNLLYFTADDGTTGVEVWRTDGTEAGTIRLADIAPGTATATPARLTAVGDALYFSVTGGPAATRGVWRSDGTPQGTVMLRNFPALTSSQANAPVASGGAVYFSATDSTGPRLWRTDGTPAGTRAVTGFQVATDSSAPYVLGHIGTRSFVSADDGTHGRELWVTDGTTGGTTLLKDINPSGNGVAGTALVVGNLLYFAGDDGRTGWELWKSDGTAAGTTLVKDLGTDSRTPNQFVEYLGELFFTRQTSGLWKSDGTAAGTLLVDPDVVITPVGAMNGRLFYTAQGELWSTDGTRAGSAMVKDINPTGPAIVSPVVRVGGQLMFFAEDGNGAGDKLYRSDGTAAGTVPVVDLNPGGPDFRKIGGAIAASGGKLFFTAPGLSGWALWASDGTAAGTRMLRDSSSAKGLYDLNGTLLFSDTTTSSNTSLPVPYLFRSDGTPEGTTMVDGTAAYFDETAPPAQVGNDLYFFSAAAPSAVNVGLAKTDGTRVTYVANRAGRAVRPDGQGGVLFSRYTRKDGEELWRYTPDGAAPAVAAGAFTDGSGGEAQKLTFRLTQDAVPEADAGKQLVLTNRVTGAAIPPEWVARSYDAASKTITFTFPRLAGGRLPAGDYRVILPAGGVTAADGDTLGADGVVDFTAGPNDPIVGRGVFYGAAGFTRDGRVAGGAAVMPDKRALLPGQTASFANITSHASGLSGVTIDFAKLPADATPMLGDFYFEWNQSSADMYRPAALEFRRGAGAGGSDRMVILWPPNVLRRGWLRVIVYATPNTGLPAPDIFYFGNLPGLALAPPAGRFYASVGPRDEVAVRNHFSTRPVAPGSGFDFNGDGRVNALDLLVSRRWRGWGLDLFTAPT